ncbi:MAG: 3-hydroxy-5-phosphonooxypentane-2,4-dione thiolase [Chloroflexi bacterium]|nr:3-hydroxy-5-phosphonooxypentane-2,4-dione thiolase [Chloroflexota bacterium]
MDWGMKNRLARILQPASGRTVMLAADHGYFMGVVPKLEVPRATLAPLLSHADALMITRGVARTSVDPETSPPLVLRVSGGVSFMGKDLANEGITTTIKEALRLNAAAVAISIFVGSDYERESLLNLSQLVSEAEEYGMPVLAVTAVGRELEKRRNRYISLACRIAAELGAHLVKTYYCERFEKVVESCPVPIVIAGGPKMDTLRDALLLAKDAMQRGARGVDMGRNIWQSQAPVPMIQAIRAVVHHNASVAEAAGILDGAGARQPELAGKKT